MIGKIAIIGATGIGDAVLYIVNEDEIVELSNEIQTVECGDLAIDAQECIEALEKVAVALSLSIQDVKVALQQATCTAPIAKKALEELKDSMMYYEDYVATWRDECKAECKEGWYFKSSLHNYDKRRCFKPKTYWNRIRSNPE
jgi:hypothetical protein